MFEWTTTYATTTAGQTDCRWASSRRRSTSSCRSSRTKGTSGLALPVPPAAPHGPPPRAVPMVSVPVASAHWNASTVNVDDGDKPPPPPPKALPVVTTPILPTAPNQGAWVDWSTRNWDDVATPVSNSNNAAWTWNCNARGSGNSWQSGSWHGHCGAHGGHDDKRRIIGVGYGNPDPNDAAASQPSTRRTVQLSQDNRLNEKLRISCCASVNIADFKLT